jgi:UDP-N-acetyl-D-galactosamine dehydrogenase
LDALIIAVAHDEYRTLTARQLSQLFARKTSGKLLFDVKGILDKRLFTSNGFKVWRL